MTTEQCNIIVEWLERRIPVCSTDHVGDFISQPATADKIKGANDLFNRFLAEAKNGRQLAIENGGEYYSGPPPVMIFRTPEFL